MSDLEKRAAKQLAALQGVAKRFAAIPDKLAARWLLDVRDVLRLPTVK